MRDEGYYWVKDIDEWMVAKWESGMFFLPAHELPSHEDSFYEIDERQIVRSE